MLINYCKNDRPTIYSLSNFIINKKYSDPLTGVDFGKESLIVVPRPSRLFKPDREVNKYLKIIGC